MKSNIAIGLLIVVLSGFFFEAGAAPNYRGTWDFSLKVVRNTCETTPTTSFTLDLTQSGTIASAVPHLIVGSSTNYSGVITADGLAMAAQSSCIVVPNTPCSPHVNAITMYHHSAGKPKKANVTYVYHKRASADNSYECSIYMKGTARKKANTSSHP
jgi:hypothetical protein